MYICSHTYTCNIYTVMEDCWRLFLRSQALTVAMFLPFIHVPLWKKNGFHHVKASKRSPASNGSLYFCHDEFGQKNPVKNLCKKLQVALAKISSFRIYKSSVACDHV